eukprot:scaffold51439_cov14-Tisochrysis_lutea.AAC.1
MHSEESLKQAQASPLSNNLICTMPQEDKRLHTASQIKASSLQQQRGKRFPSHGNFAGWQRPNSPFLRST